MPTSRINQSSVDNKPPSLSLSEAIILLTRKWKFIGFFSAICMVLAGIIIALVPNRYIAGASILPTTNENQSNSLLSMAEGIPGLDMMGLNMNSKSPSLLYPEILTSRMLMEKVLQKEYSYSRGNKLIEQNLFEYFKTDNFDLAYEYLQLHSNVSYDKKNGIVTISVTTKNPDLSAQVANYFVECLDDFNRNQRQTSAGLNRDFVMKRIEEAKSDLSLAEENLKQFRESNLNYYRSTDPELLMMHDRLSREVEVKTQVYLTLAQQYEIATIQAKKEIPIIQILDQARPPSLKSGPARIKTTLIGLLAGIFISSLMVILDYRLRDKTQYDDIKRFVGKLKIVREKPKVEMAEHV